MRLLAAVLLTACGADPAVTVFAAASTGSAIDEAVDAWSEQAGHRVQTSAAASSVLVRQVQAGAEPGVVVLAHPTWADRLQAAGGYAERTALLANRLVVIGAPDTTPPAPDAGLADAVGDCLVLADPAHVPAGMYAREALASLGVWEALDDRVVPTLDAPAAVVLVARGECPVGIAYATDAAQAGVVIGEPVPTIHHQPIRYPALQADDASEAARALYRWLQGAEARQVFASHGFGTP